MGIINCVVPILATVCGLSPETLYVDLVLQLYFAGVHVHLTAICINVSVSWTAGLTLSSVHTCRTCLKLLWENPFHLALKEAQKMLQCYDRVSWKLGWNIPRFKLRRIWGHTDGFNVHPFTDILDTASYQFVKEKCLNVVKQE